MITAPRGENGFGFDRVVVPDGQADGQKQTVAETTVDEKNANSHCRQALEDLMAQLR